MKLDRSTELQQALALNNMHSVIFIYLTCLYESANFNNKQNLINSPYETLTALMYYTEPVSSVMLDPLAVSLYTLWCRMQLFYSIAYDCCDGVGICIQHKQTCSSRTAIVLHLYLVWKNEILVVPIAYIAFSSTTHAHSVQSSAQCCYI